MRLDARNGDTQFRLYDAKRCLVPERVVWIDTDTAQWGQSDIEASRLSQNHETITIQEDSITVYLDKRLIIFNEVEDDQSKFYNDWSAPPTWPKTGIES